MENTTNVNEINIDVAEMLSQAEQAAKEQDKIPVFLIDTIYGRCVLVNRSAEAHLLDEKDYALPVKLDGTNFLYDCTATVADWLLFPEIPQDVYAESYILPIDLAEIIKNGEISGTAYTAEEIYLGRLLQFAKENCDLSLPQIRWKVTKPGMICRGMQYSVGKEYYYDGAISLHEAGYHYATDPMALFTWYRRFNPENEVYLVQVGDHIEGDTGVGVTDSLYFIKKLDWKDLLP